MPKNHHSHTSVAPPVIPVKDSIKPVVVVDTVHAPSLFKGHLLQEQHQKPIIHFTNYDYEVGVVLFFSFAVYVWLYVANRKKLNQLIKGFSLNRLANQASRDEYSGSNRSAVLLSVLFLITLTLFIGQTSLYFGYTFGESKPMLYFSIVVGLFLMYSVKIIGIKILGIIFKLGKEAGDYISSLFLFINILGLFMLPVVVGLTFVKQLNPLIFIYAGGVISVGFLCIRLLRGVLIGFNSNRVSGFYLFLYLCTLEILPFVIFLKLFLLYAK